MTESSINQDHTKSQHATSYKNRNRKLNKIGQKITCRYCSKEVIAWSWNQIFCSNKCRATFYGELHTDNREINVAKKKEIGCEICGYRKWPGCLEWHHVYANEKEYDICAMMSRKPEDVEKEYKKCILLCYNCHTEIHQGRQETSKRAISIMEQRKGRCPKSC